MKRRILPLTLLVIILTGCTVRGGWPRFLRPGEAWGWNGANSPARSERRALPAISQETPLAEMARKRDGTNYIGVYEGMIAEWSRNNKMWDPEKQCACGALMPDSVKMFSGTSGELLKWISYEDFKAIFIDKARPEYHP